ncbi:sodium-independent sulfate anion transporter isoform X1 [Anopheles bellator]|uniref:sodium-independent sulfate anion transporter isoform X1 n=1 Tax=Anopheles bellator TaxID=139047 RepID=UPI00264A4675|nr:sodium-independent sulfate anion transporter isoform X1 [Anopheles bellator]
MGLSSMERIIPGSRWLRGYTVQFAVADLIAGITVGLTVLPQGLAYATLAGLPPQYGLYSAFIGGFVYAMIGSCREVTIGPTALLSLMTSRHTSLGTGPVPEFAILLCFLSGVVELLMAVLRLGALVDLISLPVTVGFTSATALIIVASQLKALLGIGGKSKSDFVSTLRYVIDKISDIRLADTILGIGSIVVLLALRKLKDIKTPSDATRGRKIVGLACWLIATSRNALIVVATSCLAYYFEQGGENPFILTGTVKSGLPAFRLPSFRIKFPTSGGPLEYGYSNVLAELGSSIILVPIIAVLGNVAISKAFGGSGISPTRELVSLSLSNIFGSFFGSMPVTGSFSRSAVNHASGVKTPLGGIYTGALVLLALGVLTSYFQYIPKAALSAVIISAVIFMVEYEVVQPLWRCSKRELIPGAITFLLSLALGVEIGLLVGVLADLAFVVYRTARPVVSVNVENTAFGTQYISIRPTQPFIYFPAVEWVRNVTSKAIKQHGNIPVVFDCRLVNDFDYTAATGLQMLRKELEKKQIPLIVYGSSSEVHKLLQETLKSSLLEVANDEELQKVLHDLSTEEGKHELREVGIPLLPVERQSAPVATVDES